MSAFVLGNLFSAAAAIMLIISSLVARKGDIFFFALLECILLSIADIIFGEVSAAFVLLISAVRNFLLWRERYTFLAALIIFISVASFGIALSDGIVSLIPTVATLIYTVMTYTARSFVGIKLAVILNTSLWLVFSFFVFDVSSFVVNIVSLALNIASLFYYKRV